MAEGRCTYCGVHHPVICEKETQDREEEIKELTEKNEELQGAIGELGVTGGRILKSSEVEDR